MTNRYGVDSDYFRRELFALAGTLDNRPADELARYLRTLADAATPSGRPAPVDTARYIGGPAISRLDNPLAPSEPPALREAVYRLVGNAKMSFDERADAILALVRGEKSGEDA